MAIDSTDRVRRSRVQAYYPSFDGLRGIAIFAVFLCHYAGSLTSSEIVAWSWTGVDLFFILSGFLITGILFDSANSTHYYREFYKRRALRIFPLFYGVLFLIYLATWLSHSIQVRRAFALNLVYLVNLFLPFLDWRTHNPTTIRFFYYPSKTSMEATVGAFWTLCVEEQFYLIWPFILRRLRSRERIMRFCAVVIIIVPLLRLILYNSLSPAILAKHFLYQATYTRCDELFMGAWCALWLRGVKLSAFEIRRVAYITASTCLVLLVLGSVFVTGGDVNHVTNPFVSTLGFSLVGLISSALLLLSLDVSHPLAKLARWHPLSRLGKVSYSFYIFHMLPLPIFLFYLDHGLRREHCAFLALIGTFLLLYGVAWTSYRFIETPIVRLGKPRPTTADQKRTDPSKRLRHGTSTALSPLP